ncbi:sugar phosphate isomerase/epimerase [Candidatus Poribacteria bacterium]|nr:sugar phosphate isomerase/epimerase [Candidatus Poribacteria bacterium]
MKVGIRDVAFSASLDRALSIAHNLGYSGVELTLGGPQVREHPIWTRAGVRELRHYKQESRIDVSAVYFARLERLGLLHADEKVRDNAMRLCHALNPRVAELGVRTVVAPLGDVAGEGIASDSRAIETLRNAAQAAAAYQCRLAFRAALPVAEMVRLVQQVGSGCGIAYDLVDAVLRERDPAAELRELGDALCQVRVRDIAEDRSGRPLGLGIVDFPAIARSLYELDYDGYLMLDIPSGDDPVASAAASLAFAQEAIVDG